MWGVTLFPKSWWGYWLFSQMAKSQVTSIVQQFTRRPSVTTIKELIISPSFEKKIYKLITLGQGKKNSDFMSTKLKFVSTELLDRIYRWVQANKKPQWIN